MITLNEVILDAGNAAGNLTSDAVYLRNYFGYSIQAVITGTAAGSMKLQGSDDNPHLVANGPAHGQGVVNWTDIADSTEAVSGAGTITYNVGNVNYMYVRLVYTAASGTGSITARVTAKGF